VDRPARPRLVALALVSPVVGACYFTTEFDGLANGDDSLTASSEGGTSNDARESRDGGADSDLNADPADFCFGATFCDTFERSAVKGPWDSVVEVGGATLGMIKPGAPNAGSALRANVSNAAGARAAVIKKLPIGKRFELTYSLLLHAPARQSDLMALTFELDGAARRQSLFMVTKGTEVQLAEQLLIDGVSSAFDVLTEFSLPIDRWTKVKVVIELEPTPQRVTLTVDDKNVVERQPLHHAYSPSDPVLEGAVSYAQEGAAYALDFDDVRVDVTPP
jgi:hypothetical protein